MRNRWIFGAVLVCECWGQPPVKTPIQLEEELERGLGGWSDGIEASLPATRSPTPLNCPAPLGSVSVAQLGHKIPRAAQKSFARASRVAKKGDHAGAAAELENAIGRDPDFAEAYTNLGVEYGQLGHLDVAAAMLRRSVDLDGHLSMAHYNLAVALLRLGDLDGAEQSARRALEQSPENAWAHLLLGGLLWRKEGASGDGLRHIEFAARSLPEAKKMRQSIERLQ